LRARAAISPFVLTDSVRSALDSLGYAYLRNEGGYITEFEITAPRRMIVRVEDLTSKQLGFPLRSQLKLESAIEIIGVVGAPEPQEELRRCASALVSKLLGSLPKEPWKGLGLFRGGSEKDNWERLTQL
jgi:hypothetical protein